MMKLFKSFFAIILYLLVSNTVHAQSFQGKFKKMNYKCPISGMVEGYILTEDGKRIEIATAIMLNDGDNVIVQEYYWGNKTCEGKSFNICYVFEADIIADKGKRPTSMSNEEVDFYKRNGGAYIINDFNYFDSKGSAPPTTESVKYTGSNVTSLEADEALAFHNQARQKVGVHPLTWSAELSRYAQEWAEYLAFSYNCKMAHRSALGRKDKNYGENIYWARSSNGKAYTALDASKSWYSEIKDCKNRGYRMADGTGHYSQMVWHSTTQVGIGVARCPDGGYIIVANYDPPGNYIGQKAY